MKKNNSEKIIGHLMLDEIKLKNGVMWNGKNNVVAGFILDQLNTKDIIKEVLGMNDNKKNYYIIYINFFN